MIGQFTLGIKSLVWQTAIGHLILLKPLLTLRLGNLLAAGNICQKTFTRGNGKTRLQFHLNPCCHCDWAISWRLETLAENFYPRQWPKSPSIPLKPLLLLRLGTCRIREIHGRNRAIAQSSASRLVGPPRFEILDFPVQYFGTATPCAAMLESSQSVVIGPGRETVVTIRRRDAA